MAAHSNATGFCQTGGRGFFRPGAVGLGTTSFKAKLILPTMAEPTVTLSAVA